MDEPIGTLPLRALLPNDRLLLSEAIITWNDLALVEKAKAAERSYSKDGFPRWIAYRLVPDNELRQPTSGSRMVGEQYNSGLTEAWAALERSFRDMVARGQLFLEGVLINPTLTDYYQSIPGLWASNLKLDFLKSHITIQGRQYATVRVSRTPISINASIACDMGTSAPPNWAFETMGEWSDDQVLALFEEYARRVVESESARLSKAYSKVSLMPIILRKMKARFEGQENAISLKDEAIFLADWIKQKAPSFQTPAVNTVETKLRTNYQALKARSKSNN